MQQYSPVISKGLVPAAAWLIALSLWVATPSTVIAEPSSREASWQQFVETYKSFRKEWKKKAGRNRNIDLAEHRRQSRSMVATAMTLYRQNPRDKVAYEAMLFVLTYDAQHKLYEEVCRNLRSYHLRRPELSLALAIDLPLTVFNDECERLFNEAIVSGVNEQVRDTAKYTLAVIYREMTTFLANMSDLQMTPHAYLTSEARASFDGLPEKTALRISRHLHNRSWLKRSWQTVRFRALELVKEAESSSQPITHYYYNDQGMQLEDGRSLGHMAAQTRFQLENATPGAHISDFGARDLKGNPVSLAGHRGKVVVLNVWATWCKPCVKELPYLRALQQQMQGRPFELITLNIDRDINDAKNFMRRNKMPFANWYIGEDRDLLSKWPIWPLPKLFVVDPEGVIRSIPRVGHQDLTRYLERLVAEAERTASR